MKDNNIAVVKKKKILSEVKNKLISLDDKIDSISSYITEYRNATDLTEVADVVPVLLDRGESLFDGMFKSIIQNFNINIESSSEESASFNLILDDTSDAVIELDVNNKILKVNPACQAIFEYREQEFIGKSINEIISEAYHESFKKGWESSNSLNNGSHKIEAEDIHVLRGITKYGNIKSFESFTTSITRNSKPLKLMIIRDLTYNQSLIDELRESKNNYDALSETVAEVIIRIDEKFRIIFANSAVKQVFGYDRDELLNKDFKILFPVSEFSRYENEFRKYFYV
ncbi:MAG: PAS domain-containing protein, partial [Spirochaetales bacterium]|nr:PAS domain-containing protein [Spirochaetales bacterium]